MSSSFLPFITPMIYLKSVLSPVWLLFPRFAHGFRDMQNFNAVRVDVRKTVINKQIN